MAELFFFIIFINHFFGINHIIVMYQPLLSLLGSQFIVDCCYLKAVVQTPFFHLNVRTLSWWGGLSSSMTSCNTIPIRNSAPIGGLYFLQGRGQTNTDFFDVVIVVIIVIIIIINFVIVIIIIILTIVIIIFKMK